MFYCIYTCTANNEVRQLTNFTTVVSLKRLHDYNTYKVYSFAGVEGDCI